MKVLLAEDEPVTRRLLVHTLESFGHDVLEVADGNHAWQALTAEDAPRLAVLDWSMPGMDGPEICRLLQARGRGPYTYVLLLTSRQEKQDLVRGLDSGASDFLSKPIDREVLRARLRVGERMLAMQAEMLALQRALVEQATTDHLTGLLNRRGAAEALDRELARARRTGAPLAFLLADVDHFKQVNDRFGHAMGDRVLAAVAQQVSPVIRAYDLAIRWGGEEILVILPSANKAAAAGVAERLRERVAGLRLHDLPPVTISIGVDELLPGETTATEAIARADAVMYQAKAAGRNRVCVG